MGAYKPQLPEPKIKARTPFLLPLAIVAVSVLAIVLFPKILIDEEYGSPKLHPKEEERLLKRLMEIDDSEQYALIAKKDGWYPCLHSGRTTFFLKAGEVWKYGVTSKGQFGRYTAAFLLRNQVLYDIQFKGTFSECLKQEQIKLFHYRHLPENLHRQPSERLPRPPFNPITR